MLGSPCSASAITHESQQAEEGQTEPSRRVTAPRAAPGMGPPASPQGSGSAPRTAARAGVPPHGWLAGGGPVALCGRPRGSRWRDELGTISLPGIRPQHPRRTAHAP